MSRVQFPASPEFFDFTSDPTLKIKHVISRKNDDFDACIQFNAFFERVGNYTVFEYGILIVRISVTSKRFIVNRLSLIKQLPFLSLVLKGPSCHRSKIRFGIKNSQLPILPIPIRLSVGFSDVSSCLIPLPMLLVDLE